MPQLIDAPHYTRTAMKLHWLMALLIFAGYGLGHYMSTLGLSPQKLSMVAWHKWIGVTVFVLALLRGGWRLTHRPPPLPASISGLQRLAAEAVHGVLYLLMFAIPLSGWLMSSAHGYQTVYLGLLPLPDLLAKDEALAERLELVHTALNYLLLAGVAGHLGAALKHQFLSRDGVLSRMFSTDGEAGPQFAAVLGVAALLFAVALSFGGEAPEQAHEHAADAPAQVTDEAPPAQAPPATAALSSGTTVATGELIASFTQMGISVDAVFARHATELSFDPAAPQAGSVRVTVEVASFDIGDPEYNGEILGADWLDAAGHPQARFVSEAITATADGFTASGQFTLKGVTQPLSIPFTVADDPVGRRYIGTFEISRKAFGVGDPSWDDSVDDRVVIHFNLLQPS